MIFDTRRQTVKTLKYFILLLFIFSIFSCLPIAKSPKFVSEHDARYEDHEWLMLSQEKKAFKKAKSDQERERIIEQFYQARDLDTFTAKNEFKLNYQKYLKEVAKKYSSRDDPRRYIYLLYGKPKTRRAFTDQAIIITAPYTVRIRVSKGEIWQYSFGRQSFQVIFATLDPQQLQHFKGYLARDISPFSFSSSRYEILYFGSRLYTDIVDFLESFFQENFRLQETPDSIQQLKEPVLERAKEFYKKSQPKVRKEKKKYLYQWKNWKQEIQPLVAQFDINSPKEVGIAVWLLFNKDLLYYNSKKKEYRADLSLNCELRDLNNKQIIYYHDDNIEYKLKVAERHYYHFWGSLPVGDYKFILELGDNLGRKYVKIEEDIKILDYSKELKANLLIGRIIKEKERIKGKPSYLFFKEGVFCPAASGEVFRGSDELVAVFNVSGFRKNHYGNPCVEISLGFVKGKIEQGAFVASGGAYDYYLPLVEKDGSWFRMAVPIKIKDFNKKFKLPAGLHSFRVRLLVRDVIANEQLELEYSRTIRIYGTNILKLN